MKDLVTESYKIRDEFNANSLNFNFRGTAYEINGYKAKYRNDITWSGKYNETLGINQLGNFNATEINWKEVPLQCGIVERLISSDNNLTIYCENKVALAMYEKSILYDMNGVETVSLSDQVLGAVSVLDYEYGMGKNPESVVKAGGVHYFIDPKRKRFLIKQGNQIQEINPIGSGFFSESQKLLTQYKSFLATYDDKHDEYLVGFDHQLSLGFNMNYKGFTQFYTNLNTLSLHDALPICFPVTIPQSNFTLDLKTPCPTKLFGSDVTSFWYSFPLCAVNNFPFILCKYS